ncbi:MAG: OmpH family outer membrane protein [Salibacteraceae bacterium]|jgi:outer membrane protein|nr:OmpH family outer membrane protein [Salibacteraceae bacterium]MDP4687088.1 OmpH family outer membrane protein [Salibacteraceae bacterium]MDP4764537.1 OmpH family outer membrane protein [Salibacteraceae bacterium]MDP4843082.1 OmpH family outer membrane protein [Salibacteraceae bacterium]MDP4933289.1 OmpH family outer membrane protein [Salibacteraceae bacterium]
MKKLAIALLLVVATIGVTNAQVKNKFGHINSQELLEVMPEKAAADKQIEEFGKQLQKQLQTMMAERETKVSDYMENEATMSEIIAQTKAEEIQMLDQRIQTFQQNAQQSLAKKEGEAYQPILDKARKAIEEVAKENDFTYIFDVSAGALLYQPESDDIIALVKTKLGIL